MIRFGGLVNLPSVAVFVPSALPLSLDGMGLDMLAGHPLAIGQTSVHSLMFVLGTLLALLAGALWVLWRRALGESAHHRLAESRYQSLFDQSPAGIVTIDLGTQRICSANPQFQRLVGYSQVELQPMTARELTEPADWEAQQTLLRSLPRQLGVSDSMETRYIRKDGTRVWVELLAGMIYSEQDRRVVGLGIVHDISARKQAQDSLQIAKNAADHASAAKDQFLAALSHELRTPLTPVLLTAQAMLMDESLSASAREDLVGILRNVELEARLIDDLLDLTRISRGKLKLHRSFFDIHDAIRDAAEICRSDAQTKIIRIELSLDATGSTVHADASRVRQVFWNLLKNAIKFTPPGGLICVQTNNCPGRETGVDSPAILIEVSDNGVGMDADTIGRVFLPFEQGCERVTRLFGGLGMGLAISKAVVDAHGGDIIAQSLGAGKGSTFAVTLQTVPATPPAMVSEAPHDDCDVLPVTILLVEDHDATAAILARLLHRSGHRVRIASTIAAAMLAANEIEFGLVISDIGLPDGSGLDLMPRLKAIRNVPGIALSGYGMDHDVRSSRDAGFSEHLTKPINFQRLQQAISHVLALPVMADGVER